MNTKESTVKLYSSEDTQQILKIALARHSSIDSQLSHSQLLEIAQELSISPESLDIAQNQWLNQQQLIKKHQQFALYRRSKLQDRLGKYAIINVCLLPLNFLTGFGVPWSLYVLISWGMVRGVDTWRVLFQRQGSAYHRSFQKWENHHSQ
jgi:putative ubiquitin-RnfH superfamily antitoxin RatB of RatAB toxin-antitoxin module